VIWTGCLADCWSLCRLMVGNLFQSVASGCRAGFDTSRSKSSSKAFRPARFAGSCAGSLLSVATDPRERGCTVAQRALREVRTRPPAALSRLVVAPLRPRRLALQAHASETLSHGATPFSWVESPKTLSKVKIPRSVVSQDLDSVGLAPSRWGLRESPAGRTLPSSVAESGL